jgi:8-oxo-dGTP pyrophosphatase MutT (NUDIX family)
VAGRVEERSARLVATVDVSSTPLVRAAGGIVHRSGDDGEFLVLLVHRPRYDDWSLPKGKADPGERDEDTALREVEEETGLRCILGEHAGQTRYRDSKGRDKVVRYWLMERDSTATATDDAFVANDEVDQILWCSVAEAVTRLSYTHDRKLLQRLQVPA